MRLTLVEASDFRHPPKSCISPYYMDEKSDHKVEYNVI